jgi:hypothetical protein
MSKTKERDKIKVLRVTPMGDGREEVALYREDPYFNELRYAPEGTYKEGSFTEDTIEKKADVEEG